MYKLIKNGMVRIVATKAEAERWEGLGYRAAQVDDTSSPASPKPPEPPKDPLASVGIEELKAFAAKHNVDIGNTTSEKGILKKIRDVIPFTPESQG